MNALGTTYMWAREIELGRLVDAIQAIRDLPLIAVGSGGSLSAAQYCADLHQRLTGRLAKTMTPLEVVSLGGPPVGCAIIIFTASGRNADIRAALDSAIAATPPALLLVTATPQNPASGTAMAARFPVVCDLASPAGRDGFLATNSLLTFCTATYRAYHGAGLIEGALPLWDELACELPDIRALVEADTTIVLHGYDTRAAAFDLESKCTEAALAQIQLADYRNFAHGRHHWLAKRKSTALLAIIAPSDRALADKTLKLLPTTASVARLEPRGKGAIAGLSALVSTMRLVEAYGTARGIDPGRPGVPDFGSKLYSLRAIATAAPPPDQDINDDAAIAIKRKARASVTMLRTSGLLEEWRAAHSFALGALGEASYSAIVFDYDGTLVDAADRAQGPSAEIITALASLLKCGIPVGIATGRGRSAGGELRALLPRMYWERVLVGYYNGGAIASLSDERAPDGRDHVAPPLEPVLERIRRNKPLSALAKVTPRWPQITIEALPTARMDIVWDLTASSIAVSAINGIRLLRSSHSMDVIAPGVSKLNVVDAVRTRFSLGNDQKVLRIGDRGQWPGNDAEMLSGFDALSVDETAADPESAWNFAPAGLRGVRATVALCRALRPTVGGQFTVDMNTLTREPT